MQALTYSMNRWTSEQLIGEVVRRAANDGQALRLVEGVIIRARLAAGDRLRVDPTSPLAAITQADVVQGTIEMSVADEGDRAVPLTVAGHEVDEATSGAHPRSRTRREGADEDLSAPPRSYSP
jgi:hypothetical protein